MKKSLILAMTFMGVAAFSHAQDISGAKVYMESCAMCHGVKAERSPPSPEPINTLSLEQIEARLARARGDGPKGRMDVAIKNVTEEQAKAVAEYITTELRPAK